MVRPQVRLHNGKNQSGCLPSLLLLGLYFYPCVLSHSLMQPPDWHAFVFHFESWLHSVLVIVFLPLGRKLKRCLACLSWSTCILEECWACHLSNMPSNEKIQLYCFHQFLKTFICKSSRGNQCRSLAFKTQFMHSWAIRLTFISLSFKKTVWPAYNFPSILNASNGWVLSETVSFYW